MARVKRSVHGRKHHRAVLEQAKGYYGNKSRTYRAANEQLMHSGSTPTATAGPARATSASSGSSGSTPAARENGMSYSRFIAGLHQAGVDVDRKVLADLAVTDADAFAALVAVAGGAQARRRRPRSLPEPGARLLATSGSAGCAGCSRSAPPGGRSGSSWPRGSS